MIMTQDSLAFQYKVEKKTRGLTEFAGLPLYIELAVKSGFIQSITDTLKSRTRGWSDQR